MDYRPVIYLFVHVIFVKYNGVVYGQLYHITPNTSTACPQKPCISLSQFANNSSIYASNTSNVILYFLPGHHSLDLEISVSNLENFTMTSYIRDDDIVVVECTSHSAKVSVSHTTYVLLRGWLYFAGCSCNKFLTVEQLMLQNVVFQDVMNRDSALELSGVDTATIEKSYFSANSFDSHTKHKVAGVDSACVISNMVDCLTQEENFTIMMGGAVIVTFSNVLINDCTFEGNVAPFSAAAIFTESMSNISIFNSHFLFNGANSSGVIISSIIFVGQDTLLQVHNCTFKDNTAGTAVIASYRGIISISNSSFSHNRAMLSGGALLVYSSTIDIFNSVFMNSTAVYDGGVIYAYESSFYVSNSAFSGSFAGRLGGVMYLHKSTFSLSKSDFSDNIAQFLGGVFYVSNGLSFNIAYSTFTRNLALLFGGVISTSEHIVLTTFFVTDSIFSNNFALRGGVIATVASFHFANVTFSDNIAQDFGGVFATYGSFYIANSTFINNIAQTGQGGVIASSNASYHIVNCSFLGNRAGSLGGAIITNNGSVFLIANTSFFENEAESDGGVMLVSRGFFRITDCSFNRNLGSMYFFNSNVTFSGHNLFDSNMQKHFDQIASRLADEQGGAITSFDSHIFFMGESVFGRNLARDGGTVHATSSNILVYGSVLMADNTAVNDGGGVYLVGTNLKVFGRCNISQNQATKGGGVLASSSIVTVYQQGTLVFTNNSAIKGGGIYLESNAKLHLLKSLTERIGGFIHVMVIFTANYAEYGGAVYVADETNSDACRNAQECPIQTLIIDQIIGENHNFVNMVFSENFAIKGGYNLYGGMLDRCIPNPFAEIHQKWYEGLLQSLTSYNGITYMGNISNITLDSISSPPVKVCFCTIKGEPDCHYHPPTFQVKKGETLRVSVAAIDHVNRLSDAIIISSLSSTDGGFDEGQISQTVKSKCSNLTFNVFSPHDSESVTLAADGPCRSSSSSTKKFHILFSNCTCPIGFEPSNSGQTRCECICHPTLSPYIAICNYSTKSVIRMNTNSWISYNNDTDPPAYIIHPNCPFDYCYSPMKQVSINLNKVDGADAQCQFNRTGILCGACHIHFSLSLGSSRCLPCHHYWPLVLVTIFLAAILAGVLLVIILLVLNMTVADGSINGFIFYANTVAACGAVLFPSSEPSFPTLFIAWLNLDIGFDLCIFPGLDAYTKTWVQLAFPVYIISLVCIIIVISRHNSIFARQIGRRDPVATLATLILLSYTKLLSTTILVLSFANLHYPDGSHVRVWLPDGSVPYFRGKHVVLVLVVIFIIVIGVPYTVLLFSWQWLVQTPDWKSFKWTRDTKLHGFLSTHHAPYVSKYRYWTGLLLIVRVILYIISAITLSNNPQIPLIVMIVLLGGILLLKAVQKIRVYNKLYIELSETIIYLNLLYYAAFTLYNFKNDNTKQTNVAHTSAVITCILFAGILLYNAIQLAIHQLQHKTKRSFIATDQRNQRKRAEVTFSVIEISNIPIPSPNLQLHVVNQSFQNDGDVRCSMHSPHNSIDSDEEQESC